MFNLASKLASARTSGTAFVIIPDTLSVLAILPFPNGFFIFIILVSNCILPLLYTGILTFSSHQVKSNVWSFLENHSSKNLQLVFEKTKEQRFLHLSLVWQMSKQTNIAEQRHSFWMIVLVYNLYYFIQFFSFLAVEDNAASKSRTDDISLKITTLPDEPPPEREAQCRETPTEGATAKVIISAPTSTLLSFMWSIKIFFITMISLLDQPFYCCWCCLNPLEKEVIKMCVYPGTSV